jgi:phosphohistidine swiveling domain-containing protein
MIVEKERRTALSKIKSNSKIIKQLKQLGKISWWWDHKKGIQLLGIQFLFYLSKIIAERLNCSLEEIILLKPREVHLSLKRGKLIINKEELTIRKTSLHTFSGKNGKIYALYGNEAESFSKKLFNFRNKMKEKDNSIKGIVGSSTKNKIVRGIAKIVLNPNSTEFISGEILVTSMTRPEFLPIIGKALAVVADEGGIAAHTSIVCREFGIPAIVGTRLATQIIKTGDLIELNTETGVVSIIEKFKKRSKNKIKNDNEVQKLD